MFDAVGERVEVLNAGVGNYNAERSIHWFFTQLKALAPTDVVVHYFLRAGEQLEPGGGNVLLRNSQLAVTIWIAAQRLVGDAGEASLLRHYQEVYAPDRPGWIATQAQLRELAEYCKANNIRYYLAMMPDIHDLENYQFGFVHQAVKQVAESNGYIFIDLLPAFGRLAPRQIWAMPGDPHPNAVGHTLMAKALFPILRDADLAR
jgi:hypothetical protein